MIGLVVLAAAMGPSVSPRPASVAELAPDGRSVVQSNGSNEESSPLPEASPRDLDASDVPRREDEVALSSGALRSLVAASGSGEVGDVAELNGLRVSGERVRVEIIHDLSNEEIRSLVATLGGVVRGEVPGELVEADIPIDRLVELEQSAGVALVRPPLMIDAPADPGASVPSRPAQDLIGGSVVGQEVGFTNIPAWHAAGFNGAGIRVGIIDFFNGGRWNAAQAAREVPAPAGTFCRSNASNCSVFGASSGTGAHGVAVAEIIHEMAPRAVLYLAMVSTTSDLQAAVNYFASQGVKIISRSLGSRYDGAGNGTGPIAAVVNSAVAQGITWFNAAGNSAGRDGRQGGYWRGSWRDTDADGWLNFASGSEVLAHDCGFFFGLRWSDWSATRTDYDIYLYDAVDSPTPFAQGSDVQGSGGVALEHPTTPSGQPSSAVCASGEDIDYLAIRLFSPGSGTSGDVLEVMVDARIENHSNKWSAAQPAVDSASAGALAVGAIDPPEGIAIAPYSSEGPTNSGRRKPDLSADACVRSFTYSPDCFDGTSAATPVAAGAAAVILDSGWASAPSALRSFMMTYLTDDRGASGPDNVFGAGELILPEFADTATSQFRRHIDWVWNEGITAGCSPGRYCPNGVVTRGQMATFLVRALSLPPTSTDYFTDDEGSTHENNINRLRAAGITAGCSPGRYCPNGVVTRGQMATFLSRAFHLPATSVDYFTDDETNIHESRINRLRAAGITSGCTSTTYCPNGSVTRGQMAAFLFRGLP